MTDLISRSAAINVLQELADKEVAGKSISDIGFGLTMAIGRLISAPALEAVPVVHARWKMTDSPYCSSCNRIAVLKYRYCPNCGARMDGGADG